MRVQMNMVSDWSTLPQAGKWGSKVRTSMHKRIILQTWHSPEGHTFNQIDHCMIDERHFADVIDVMARRNTNINSDHMLVVIKYKTRIY
jgi:endonuclease/exonuclease/phosphatase family metal-dependent hydrolase